MIFAHIGCLVLFHLNGDDSTSTYQVSIKISYDQSPSIIPKEKMEGVLPPKSSWLLMEAEGCCVRPSVTPVIKHL
jgi:hypothetical protein